MELTFTPYRIECTHPFGISRSTHNHYDIIYIYLESDGTVGRGEAAPSNRYGETFSDCIEILNIEYSKKWAILSACRNPKAGIIFVGIAEILKISTM